MSKLPKTMKGVWLTGHGETNKLDFRIDIPVPKPTANDVLIRVGATAVNNTDINTRTAWYSKGKATINDASWAGIAIDFPRIQGIDVCGNIVAVGKNVSKNRIGERVLVEPCLREIKGKALSKPFFLGSECDGGFAEFVVVASRHAFQVKSSLSDIELASFPCSYSTAENMLTKSKVISGELVLVTGASGGVGSAAVQLIKARGANVFAVTTVSKTQDLIKLGATKIIYRDQDVVETLGSNSVDVVIDLVGGKKWPAFLEVLRPGGRYVVSGAIAGALVGLDLRTLYLKDLSFFGCTVLESNVFADLIDHIENRNIKPVVAHTFPLKDIVKAQELFLQKKHIGKIVLTINTY